MKFGGSPNGGIDSYINAFVLCLYDIVIFCALENYGQQRKRKIMGQKSHNPYKLSDHITESTSNQFNALPDGCLNGTESNRTIYAVVMLFYKSRRLLQIHNWFDAVHFNLLQFPVWSERGIIGPSLYKLFYEERLPFCKRFY